MRKCIDNLKLLLDIEQQCIWINTYEESNLLNDITKLYLSSDNEMPHIYVWSVYEGIKRLRIDYDGIVFEPPVKGTNNPVKALEHIKTSQDNPSDFESIYILRDLHSALDNQGVVIRGIRDLKETKPLNYCPIIVSSPVIEIPKELEKLFAVMDYDLPDKDDIRIIINKSIEHFTEHGKKLDISEDDLSSLVNSCTGLTQNEIISAFKKSIVEHETLKIDAIMNEKIELVKKSGLLDYAIPYCGIDDIGGNHELKNWLEETKEAMEPEAISFGCAKPKGFMSIGIPGCSKTMFANAVAKDWNMPLLQLSMSKIMNKLVGQSERQMAQALRIAEACSPCILLIDEIEKALGGFSSSNQSDSGTTARTFEQVLQFLQKDNDVFVIMTSNNIKQLPPELYRSERLDSIWYFSLPTREEREEIFNIHLKATNKDFDKELIEYCVDNTNNFTGAEIAQSVKNGIRKAYSRYKDDGINQILEEDMQKAIDDVAPIYNISREQILSLETWAKGRAKYTNNESQKKEYAKIKNNKLLDMLETELSK